MAFANSRCIVDAVCPIHNPLCLTKAVRRTYAYHALSPLDSLLTALNSSLPDLIVPGDDLANNHLHDLYYSLQKKSDPASNNICKLIEHSIGSPESFPIVVARAAFMELAGQEGIRVPKTAALADVQDLEEQITRMGFPVVLKTDGSSSGEGVRIVLTPAEAKRAFYSLRDAPPLIRVAKRVVIGQDMRWLRATLFRRCPVVNVQEFVSGRDATSLVACWKGEVLAALHFEVINKQYERGPASVLRLIENQEMDNAARKAVRRLNISGLHGFDFLLEKESEKAFLIEMNPRATQVGHLALGPGRDLPTALTAAVSGRAIPESPRVTENLMIALFPQEWSRDPGSPLLNSAYHDIPWEDPDLVRYCLRKSRKWNDRRSVKDWIYIFSAHRPPVV
jgi:Carbamoyl-phosphate synthase L chain, ATP binding domain